RNVTGVQTCALPIYLQQVLAGLPGAPVRRLVVTLELTLQHTIGVPCLLLLLQLQQVLGLLDPATAVLARREGTTLESLISTDERSEERRVGNEGDTL